MSRIVTLDLGTSYFKAGLFDETGRLIGLSRRAPPIAHPDPFRWELDPAAFFSCVALLFRDLAAAEPSGFGGVAAISFATQTNSFLLLDAEDRPLTPIILWPDERATEFGDQLNSLSMIAEFRATSGIRRLCCQSMVAKLLWIKQQPCDIWRRAARLCLISDYLTLRLTGAHVTEAAAAGLTGLEDIQRLMWLPEVCQGIGLPLRWLPSIVRGGTDVGRVRPEAAAELGLPKSCRFVVGLLDQYAGAVGVGNIAPGCVSETTGTVLSTVCSTEGLSSDLPAGVTQGPASIPGRYYCMVHGEKSANLLEWYRNHLPDRPSFADLDKAAADVPSGCEGLRVRANPRLTSLENVFEGLNDRHARGHLARAIMECVAQELDGQVRLLRGAAKPRVIYSSGGGARSSVWQQIKADALKATMATSKCVEPTSLGAAIVAANSLGWGELPELASQWVVVDSYIRPRR
jgi:xylulokinase